MAEQNPQQLQLTLEQHKAVRRILGENADTDHTPLPLEPTGDSERSPHVDENGRAILGSRAITGAQRSYHTQQPQIESIGVDDGTGRSVAAQKRLSEMAVADARRNSGLSHGRGPGY